MLYNVLTILNTIFNLWLLVMLFVAIIKFKKNKK